MDLTDQQFADPYGDFEKQDYDEEQSSNIDQNQSSSQPSQARRSAPMIGSNNPRRQVSREQLESLKQLRATKMAASIMEKALNDKEKELDDKINRLNKLSKDELEELREKRLDSLKKKAEQREKWVANNHGRMIDINDQKDFFSIIKTSKYVICMFYSKQNKWCDELREHLTLLARQHLECKFTQINAETCPFLLERLNVWMMPTILLAKDFKVDRQLRGLDWVAPDGKLNTIKLEQKLFEYGFLEETYLAIKNQVKSVANQHRKQEESDDEDDGLDL